MPLYHPIVPARYAAPLLTCLAQTDNAMVRSVLAEIGMLPSDLLRQDATMTVAEFDRLFTALHEHTGRTDLGFDFGLGITVESHGALGDAMAHCQNLGELLALAARFTRLMTPIILLRHRRDDDFHELLWQPAAGMSTFTLHAFFELHVTSTYRLLETLLGDRLTPYDVWLPMPRPAHIARYTALDKLTVHFGTQSLPEVKTHFSNMLANTPLRLSDAPCNTSLDELARLQRPFSRGGTWRDWVALMLRESEGHQPSQVELAALMSIGAHTLARRLREEQCSFRELANRIRHERACELLRDQRQGIEQIGYRLGYEQVSNFSHAFRRQQGESPRAYRHRILEDLKRKS